MELLIIAIGAGLIIIASVVRALVARSRHLPLGSDRNPNAPAATSSARRTLASPISWVSTTPVTTAS